MTIPVSHKYIKEKSIRHAVVKINCKNGECYGSGTIVKVGSDVYVLTAKHCVQNNEDLYAAEDVKILRYAASGLEEFPVSEIFAHDTKDCAALKLCKSERIESEVILFTNPLNIEYSLIGFPGEINKYKKYQFTYAGDNNFQYKGPNYNDINDSIFKGLSGSGIFLAEEHGKMYMCGYLIGESEASGNNEFNFETVENFKELIPDLEILSDSDQQLEPAGTYVPPAPRQIFQPIGTSLLKRTKLCETPFISSGKLREIIDILRGEEPVVYLSALSGLGKTRLLYEAYSVNYDLSNCFYADFYDNPVGLTYEAEQILISHNKEEGLLIVDNCPHELLHNLVTIQQQYQSDFRIVATTHDFFSDNKSRDWYLLLLKPSDIKPDIDDYIRKEIGTSSEVMAIVENIQKISDGYPWMAIKLIEAYRQGENPDVDIVRDLMPKIMQYDDGHKDEQEKMMRAISLFQPMPYSGSQTGICDYILSDNCLTRMYGKGLDERRDVLHRLITKYNNTLIEKQGDWLNVRPFPLAVYLTKEWFESCEQTKFTEFLKNLKEQTEQIQSAVIENFSKHFKYMQGNTDAINLINQLLGEFSDSPFFNEEVLCSALGSRLLLAMSSVNPKAVAGYLHRHICSKSVEWLKTTFTDTPRRNIVWALEKLVFAHESFAEAFDVLALLAVAENENLGNNATSQFRQLFQYLLPGTEVSLSTRLKALRRIAFNDEDHAALCVSCMPIAMTRHGMVRMGGAESFGLISRKDYMPKNKNEIFDYRKGMCNLVGEIGDAYATLQPLIADKIQSNIAQWVGDHALDIVKPLVDKTLVVLGSHWTGLYQELNDMMRYSPEDITDEEREVIDDWIKKTRPKTFVTEMRERSADFWDIPFDDRNIDKAHEMFMPLAERFVEEKIYDNVGELVLMLCDNDSYYTAFVDNVFGLLNEEQKSKHIDSIITGLADIDNLPRSRYVLDIAGITKGTALFNRLAAQIFDQKKYDLFVRVFTYNDKDLSGYEHLKSAFAGVGDYDFVSSYLNNCGIYDSEHLYRVLNSVYTDFPDSIPVLIEFIEDEQYRFMKVTDERLMSLLCHIVLTCQIGPDSNRIAKYNNVVLKILKQNHDRSFARGICQKFIDIYNKNHVHLNRESVFSYLIKNYTDDVWDMIWAALVSEKHYLFYFNVKNELGSGFGFGSGPMFQLPDSMKRVQAVCSQYPEVAPVIVAEMAPCYSSNNAVDGFSDYFLWLIENYGDNDLVLSSLHANLGSFSWTGSILPYHERNILCFEKLQSSSTLSANARKWVEDCLKYERQHLQEAKNRETYLRMHYE